MCSDQSPWAVSDDLAYGFTAVSGANPTCCQCYQLTFTSGPVSGKKMIVQATNTGTDVGEGHFDLAVRFLSFLLPVPSLSSTAFVYITVSRTLAYNFCRSPAAVSVSSTAALPNGVLRKRSGVLATVALRLTPALSSPVLCNRAVGSGGIGCRVLITRSKLLALCFLSLIFNHLSC